MKTSYIYKLKTYGSLVGAVTKVCMAIFITFIFKNNYDNLELFSGYWYEDVKGEGTKILNSFIGRSQGLLH